MANQPVKGETPGSRRVSPTPDYWLRSKHRRSSVRSIIDSIVGNDPYGSSPGKQKISARSAPACNGLASRNRSSTDGNDSLVAPRSLEKRDPKDLDLNPSRPPGCHVIRRLSLPCVLSALKKSKASPKLVTRALSSSEVEERKGRVESLYQRQSSWIMVSKARSDKNKSRRTDRDKPSLHQVEEEYSSRSKSGLASRSVSPGTTDRLDPALTRSDRLSTCREDTGQQSGQLSSAWHDSHNGASPSLSSRQSEPLAGDYPRQSGIDELSGQEITCSGSSIPASGGPEKSLSSASEYGAPREPSRSRFRSRAVDGQAIPASDPSGQSVGQSDRSTTDTSVAASTSGRHAASSNSSSDTAGPTTWTSRSQTATDRPKLSAVWANVSVADRLRWLAAERHCDGGGNRSDTAPTSTTGATTSSISQARAGAQEARRCSKGVIPAHLRPRIRSEELGTVKSFWR